MQSLECYVLLLVCGRRYKNGPGLKYHYTHYNHEQETSTVHHEEPAISHPSTPAPSAPAESPKVPSPQPRGPGRPKKIPGAAASPNNYCDFCLGDVYENKKTGQPEELLSCADCGRSGRCHFVVSICGVIYVAFIFVAAACLWVRFSHYVTEKPASTSLAHDATE